MIYVIETGLFLRRASENGLLRVRKGELLFLVAEPGRNVNSQFACSALHRRSSHLLLSRFLDVVHEQAMAHSR